MEDRSSKIQRVTFWGAVCNVMLAALKFIAGTIGHSAAMMADAVHSLSDLVSDVIVIVFARIAAQGKDKNHDYGHGKFETLATLMVSLALLAAGASMVSSSVGSITAILKGESSESPRLLALAAAAISIIVKEVLYQWTARVGRKVSSQAMIANAWHHRTDALSSIASLIGIGGAMALGGRWLILDPLVGCCISIFIIYIAVKIAGPALSELTDASLSDETESEIHRIISEVPGVIDVHEMKTRQCGHYSIVEAHIVVDPDASVREAHAITEIAEENLREKFGNELQVSLHVEPSVDSK